MNEMRSTCTEERLRTFYRLFEGSGCVWGSLGHVNGVRRSYDEVREYYFVGEIPVR